MPPIWKDDVRGRALAFRYLLHMPLRGSLQFGLLGLMLLLVPACGPTSAAGAESARSADEPVDGIVFVHGIAGSGADWNTLVERFRRDGWPEDRLIAGSLSDPTWASNKRNAEQIDQWVKELSERGAQRIAVVAHSMGGLSSRYFLQRVGGTSRVAVFVTLGTMHHGLFSSCLSPVPVRPWQELCAWGSFLADLNKAPATPGPTRWVSIFSSDDAIVSPGSSRLEGAQNIELEGIGHDGANGFQRSALVYERLKHAL